MRLEPDEGKLSRPVLRGLGRSNPARLRDPQSKVATSALEGYKSQIKTHFGVYFHLIMNKRSYHVSIRKALWSQKENR